MLKLAFMDASSCVRTGVMNFRIVCQNCTCVLKRIVSISLLCLDNQS